MVFYEYHLCHHGFHRLLESSKVLSSLSVLMSSLILHIRRASASPPSTGHRRPCRQKNCEDDTLTYYGQSATVFNALQLKLIPILCRLGSNMQRAQKTSHWKQTNSHNTVIVRYFWPFGSGRFCRGTRSMDWVT